jgi:hypothetical protein
LTVVPDKPVALANRAAALATAYVIQITLPLATRFKTQEVLKGPAGSDVRFTQCLLLTRPSVNLVQIKLRVPADVPFMKQVLKYLKGGSTSLLVIGFLHISLLL